MSIIVILPIHSRQFAGHDFCGFCGYFSLVAALPRWGLCGSFQNEEVVVQLLPSALVTGFHCLSIGTFHLTHTSNIVSQLLDQRILGGKGFDVAKPFEKLHFEWLAVQGPFEIDQVNLDF